MKGTRSSEACISRDTMGQLGLSFFFWFFMGYIPQSCTDGADHLKRIIDLEWTVRSNHPLSGITALDGLVHAQLSVNKAKTDEDPSNFNSSRAYRRKRQKRKWQQQSLLNMHVHTMLVGDRTNVELKPSPVLSGIGTSLDHIHDFIRSKSSGFASLSWRSSFSLCMYVRMYMRLCEHV